MGELIPPTTTISVAKTEFGTRKKLKSLHIYAVKKFPLPDPSPGQDPPAFVLFKKKVHGFMKPRTSGGWRLFTYLSAQ